MTARHLLEKGLVPDLFALADVSQLFDEQGARQIRVRMHDGWHLDVLPDRGLDIGQAWFSGRQISWRSPIATDPGPNNGWDRRFLGGLLVTCGPDFIGPGTLPNGSHGLHGSHSTTPASEVAWRRQLVGDEVEVAIEGQIDDVRMFGRRIRIKRMITLRTGSAEVVVRDQVFNLGLEPARVAVLHHVNLGSIAAPPGSTIHVDAQRFTIREETTAVASPHTMPQPIDFTEEAVFRWDGLHSARGVARASVHAPAGITTLRWDAATQPFLMQWMMPSRGVWALGLEPSTEPLFGIDRTEQLINPGETLSLEIAVEHSTS